MARLHPFYGATNVGYYCDESSHTEFKETFFSVGGLAVPDKGFKPDMGYRQIVSDLEGLRDLYGAKDHRTGEWLEIKWNGPACLNRARVEFAQYLARKRRARELNFHIIFCDRRHFGDNDIHDTVGKLYWQLLLRKAVYFYGNFCPIYVRPDGGKPTDSIMRYQHHLSAKGRKLFMTKRGSIASIDKRESKKNLLLQLLDVTMGALTAKRNNRVLGERRTRLMNDIHEAHGRPPLHISSNTAFNTFNIWNFVPYGGDEDDEEYQLALPGLS